jgi:hypothetical protein
MTSLVSKWFVGMSFCSSELVVLRERQDSLWAITLHYLQCT